MERLQLQLHRFSQMYDDHVNDTDLVPLDKKLDQEMREMKQELQDRMRKFEARADHGPKTATK